MKKIISGKFNLCYKTKERNLDKQNRNLNMIWTMNVSLEFNLKISLSN